MLIQKVYSEHDEFQGWLAQVRGVGHILAPTRLEAIIQMCALIRSVKAWR